MHTVSIAIPAATMHSYEVDVERVDDSDGRVLSQTLRGGWVCPEMRFGYLTLPSRPLFSCPSLYLSRRSYIPSSLLDSALSTQEHSERYLKTYDDADDADEPRPIWTERGNVGTD